MNTSIANSTELSQWSTSARRSAAPALDIRTALRESFRQKEIPGIRDVRVLPRDARSGTRHKAFVILATQDVDRDFAIIQLLDQFAELDYDLVPESSARLVPDGARPLGL
jgi:hypothetical protein